MSILKNRHDATLLLLDQTEAQLTLISENRLRYLVTELDRLRISLSESYAICDAKELSSIGNYLLIIGEIIAKTERDLYS